MKIIYFAAISSLMLLTACGSSAPVAIQATPVPATATHTPAPQPTPTEEPTATAEGVEEESMEMRESTQEPMPAVEAAEPETEMAEAMPPEEKEMMTEDVEMPSPQPTETQQRLLDSLTVIGSPAELNNEVWLNSEPLKLTDLRGRVVIIEFWTFG